MEDGPLWWPRKRSWEVTSHGLLFNRTYFDETYILYIYTPIDTYIYTYVYIYTYIYTHVCLWCPVWNGEVKSIVYLNEVHYNKIADDLHVLFFHHLQGLEKWLQWKGWNNSGRQQRLSDEYVPLQAWNLLDLIWSFWRIYCLISSWLFATAFSVALAKQILHFCSVPKLSHTHHITTWFDDVICGCFIHPGLDMTFSFSNYLV